MTGPDWSKLIYVAIMAAIVATLGLFSLRSLLALGRLRTGIAVTGRIIGKRIDDDDGTYYHITYSFPDASGMIRTKEIELRKTHFERLEDGETVRVVYQADRPDNSYLGDPLFMQSHARSMRKWLLVALVLTFIVASFVHQCVLLNRC